MPNHIHGIVWIVEVEGGATGRSPRTPELPARWSEDREDFPSEADKIFLSSDRLPALPRGPASRSLSSFIAGFKSAVTKRINEWRGTPGASVWQRNYYERILRDERALASVRRYIRENPRRWEADRERGNQ
ncbi:MAG: hypothetical protein WHS87_06225 [Anaerolineales bacterium]